jgi:ribosomal protein S18 acetylase RimI-like enzyme
VSTAVTFRAATPSDATDVALLTNIATHGLTAVIWASEEGAAGTYNPIEVGRQHVLRDGDDLSWRHATIAASSEEVVGLLLGFRDEPRAFPADLPAFAVPFFEMRREAPGAWYISMISVYAPWRHRGIGFQLMEIAQAKRLESAANGLSLIVEDVNIPAQRFYERCGFTVRTKRPMVPFPGGGPDGVLDWLLMVKD